MKRYTHGYDAACIRWNKYRLEQIEQVGDDSFLIERIIDIRKSNPTKYIKSCMESLGISKSKILGLQREYGYSSNKIEFIIQTVCETIGVKSKFELREYLLKTYDWGSRPPYKTIRNEFPLLSNHIIHKELDL